MSIAMHKFGIVNTSTYTASVDFLHQVAPGGAKTLSQLRLVPGEGCELEFYGGDQIAISTAPSGGNLNEIVNLTDQHDRQCFQVRGSEAAGPQPGASTEQDLFDVDFKKYSGQQAHIVSVEGPTKSFLAGWGLVPGAQVTLVSRRGDNVFLDSSAGQVSMKPGEDRIRVRIASN